MSLTGRALPILLTLLVVGAFVVALLLWQRVRGPRWAREGQHLGLLLLNQAAAVALVIVLANDAGDFYSSWSDLFGTDKGTASEYSVHGDRRVSTPPLSDEKNTKFSTTAQRPQRGELVSAVINGAASGLHVKVDVYRPPQYFQLSHARDLFPVIELVDGEQGAAGNRERTATATAFLQLIATGKAQPAVLVIVEASGADWNTACVSTSSGPQTPSFLDADLPLALAGAYRVQTRGWGIAGIGADGYCAAKLALIEPNIFWAAAPIDAYFTPRAPSPSSAASQNILTYQNDLLLRLRRQPVPPARLLVLDTAGSSATARAQTSTLRSLAEPPMQVTIPLQQPPTTTAATVQALQWLTQHLQVARPGPD